jgi:hypothetical protein
MRWLFTRRFQWRSCHAKLSDSAAPRDGFLHTDFTSQTGAMLAAFTAASLLSEPSPVILRGELPGGIQTALGLALGGTILALGIRSSFTSRSRLAPLHARKCRASGSRPPPTAGNGHSAIDQA